jgi:hypothetical protein
MLAMTLRRLWEKGVLKGTRINQRRIIYDRDSVFAWLGIPLPGPQPAPRKPGRPRKQQELVKA